MPNLLGRLRGQVDTSSERSDWFQKFFFNGTPHPLFPAGSMPGSPAEHVGGSLTDRVNMVRERNGVVAAAVHARALLVSQLRFAWRDEITGNVFGDGTLAPLERPGSDSRPRLLSRLEEDVCWTGNAYVRRVGGTLYRLRPDWVDLIVGSNESPDDVAHGADAEVVGYRYWPGGNRDSGTPMAIAVTDVAHIAPEAHPLRAFVGASWVTSILRDIVSDGQATDHIEQYFEHAATANMVVKAPEGLTRDQFFDWVKNSKAAQEGVQNAWSNMYVASGTDVQVVGSQLADLDLKQLTGAFEARITVRSRVPAPVLGTREGMQGSALNSGNYGQVRRLWADGWFSPYADIWCASLEQIVPPRRSFVELTYLRDRILFLQEDEKDAAEIVRTMANSIRTLSDGGYDPTSVIEAVHTGDLSKLVHTGRPSVQLQSDAEVSAASPGGDDDE